MTDPVEKLRKHGIECRRIASQEGGDGTPYDELYLAGNYMSRAADEIERLRHALRDCSAASGIPDRGDALRVVIKIVDAALAAKEE